VPIASIVMRSMFFARANGVALSAVVLVNTMPRPGPARATPCAVRPCRPTMFRAPQLAYEHSSHLTPEERRRRVGTLVHGQAGQVRSCALRLAEERRQHRDIFRAARRTAKRI
jgi:hypothetical protein